MLRNFEEYDLNGDGFLSADEVKDALGKFLES